MFGEAGEQWRNKLEKSCQAAAARLRGLVYAREGAYLGIWGGAGEISFLELRREKGSWSIGRRAEERWQRPGDFGEMAGCLAERTLLRLQREGWEHLPLALCLPEEECICKLFPMSGHIPAQEQKTAAFWEIDSFLQSCGLSAETAESTWARLPGEEGAVEALILLREKISLLEGAFGERGCHLAGLFPETPLLTECRREGKGWLAGSMQLQDGGEEAGCAAEGQRRALYAAAALAGLGSPGWPGNFLAGEGAENPWNYGGIAKIALTLAAAALALMLAADLGQLYLASQQEEEARLQLAALEPERQVMEEDKRLSSLAEGKEARLGRLSQQSRPLDSVLVHLGTVTVEGAWLREVDCSQENALLLQGEAVDYSALGELMAAFEKDRDFFTALPLLEDSRQKQGGAGVEFRLRIEGGRTDEGGRSR